MGRSQVFRFSISKHFDAIVATKGRITAPPQVRLLFPPLLLVDEGEVFLDGVLPLLQFFIGQQMLI